MSLTWSAAFCTSADSGIVSPSAGPRIMAIPTMLSSGSSNLSQSISCRKWNVYNRIWNVLASLTWTRGETQYTDTESTSRHERTVSAQQGKARESHTSLSTETDLLL